MKVITWNLGYASITSPSINNQETVNSALKYIEDKADVVLAQEMYISAMAQIIITFIICTVQYLICFRSYQRRY